MLRDKRLYVEFEKQLTESASGEPARPDIAGNSREAQEIHKVNVTLTHLLRVMARNYAIALPKGPVYPAEIMAAMQAVDELADLDDDIEAAMKVTAPERKSWKESRA